MLVDGWFVTADAGRLDPDGRLQVLGRVDDVVVSGGVNVPGPAVAARLRAHPDVVAAEVVGVPDEEWGHRLVAFVVGPLDLDAARDWVAAAHPREWAPRQVVAVDAIPLLPNGKPDRRALHGARMTPMHVLAIPMRTRFRGITVREVALVAGRAPGWGEWSPFLEYDAAEARALVRRAPSRPPSTAGPRRCATGCR